MTRGVTINSAPKLNRLQSQRTVSLEHTLNKAKRVAAEKGVTRVADITGLDRIGIPVHSAVAPRSLEGISVSNGKGVTPVESRVSALMEAIERQTALHAKPELIEASLEELLRAGKAVVSADSFNHQLSKEYDPRRRSFWIHGYDFLNDETVLVPASLAGYGPRFDEPNNPLEMNGSNGLASGNCFEEAVCHGLCELIERDAWTLADLKSHWIPFARREKLFGSAVAQLGFDDPNAHPRIDFEGIGEPIAGLLQKFERAGLQPVVRDITSDLGIPTVLAVAAEDTIPGFPQAHGGAGAHPNVRVAVTRALTELAQSRAADIHGVREDLKAADAAADPARRAPQRVAQLDHNSWMLQNAGAKRAFGEIRSVENDDVAADIELILSRLRASGIDRVIVVDFSEPGSPFSVVRVMVPGLESWALERSKIGQRASAFWRKHF